MDDDSDEEWSEDEARQTASQRRLRICRLLIELQSIITSYNCVQ